MFKKVIAANLSVSCRSPVKLLSLLLVGNDVLFDVWELCERLIARVTLPIYVLSTSLRIVYANRFPKLLILFLLYLKSVHWQNATLPIRKNFFFVVHEASYGAHEGIVGTTSAFWGHCELLGNFRVLVPYRQGDCFGCITRRKLSHHFISRFIGLGGHRRLCVRGCHCILAHFES